MNPRTAIRISAALGFLGVALGAFGAHGLQPQLHALGTVDIWQTAERYHLIHAAVMLFLASRPRIGWSWDFFLAGIVLFSGSLYAVALARAHWLWPFAPLGGLCFMIGWLLLAIRGLPE